MPKPVGGGHSFVEIAGGTCGRTGNLALYCWGQNNVGQAGLGFNSSTVLAPSPVVGATAFTQISSNGGNFNCGMSSTSGAFCWGGNLYGNLGDGTKTNRNIPTPVAGSLPFVEIRAGGGHACGRVTGGAVYCWGLNQFGELGDGTTIDHIVPALVSGALAFTAITLGGELSCGLVANGAAYCWGDNSYGQVGDGTSSNARVAPTAVSGGQRFIAIASGGSHACGRTIDNAVYCWGGNLDGALGDGTTTSRSTPILVRVP